MSDRLTEAERRLRDLAIGESHHLASTFPPEIWDRVVVIAWPQLSEAAEVCERLGTKAVGLALEHHFQSWASPLANAARRAAKGGWRPVDRTRSVSVGARSATEVKPLFDVVRSLWDAAAALGPRDKESPEAFRCVRPSLLLHEQGLVE